MAAHFAAQLGTDAAAGAAHQDGVPAHDIRDRLIIEMDRLALQNVLHGHVSNRGEIDVSFHHLPDAGKNLWDNATLRAPVGDAADVLTRKLADSDQRLFGAMISDDPFHVGGSSQHP